MWVLASFVFLAISFVVGSVLGVIPRMIVYGDLGFMTPHVFSWAQFWTYELVSFPIYIIQAGFGYVLQGGLQNMAYNRLEGRPIEIGDMFSGFQSFGSLFIAGAVAQIATFIGFVLLVLPGFYVIGAVQLAPLMIIRQNKSGVEGLKESAKLLGSQAWLMFLIVFLSGILSAMGCLLCGIGIIITFPIYYVTVTMIYASYFPPSIRQQNLPNFNVMGQQPPNFG